MANEIATGPVQIPAFLQAALAAQPASADSASMATAQNSTPRLSLRAKIFRFMEGQDEVYKSKDPIKVYIVGVEPGAGLFTKTWYSKPYAGSDSAGEPPDCSSADGLRPDPWINQPVHSDCKACPKNQFGSATSRKGRPSKACQDSKRLYIARVEEPIKGKLYTSQVPVSSLEALANFGKQLQSMGVEPWMVQTKMSMVEDSEFPELTFEIGGFIDEPNMVAMKERAAKREWAVSRNLMLQNNANQPRPVLPPHLQQMMGQQQPPVQPAQQQQPVGNPLGAPGVDPNLVAAAQVMNTAAGTAANGQVPSNSDILKNW